MNTSHNSIPSFWRRAGACAIDVALLMTGVVAVQVFLNWLTGGLLQLRLLEMNNKLLSYGYVLLTFSFVPYNLYFSVLESSGWQATLGKRLFGLGVTDVDGNRIDIGRAVLRTTVKFLPWELGHISAMLLSDFSVTGISLQADFPFTPETRFFLEETAWAGPVKTLAVILLGVYIVLALFNRRKRSVHDWVAGTAVTRT